MTRNQELRKLADALAATRQDQVAKAERLEQLIATGDLEEADIALAGILLDVHRDRGPGHDLAAVRVLTALIDARVARRMDEDVERGLATLEALLPRVGRDAASVGDTHMTELADALEKAGDSARADRARSIAARLRERARSGDSQAP